MEKVITQDILLPAYRPYMLYNNGASLCGKGLHFSFAQVKESMREFYRLYHGEGHIITIDLKQFFPTAPHETLYNMHRKYLLDSRITRLADLIIQSLGRDVGMPIGVEPSQAEMIAAPSALDSYIACQLCLSQFGHYMDDYILFVPPHMNPKHILEQVIVKAAKFGFTVNRSKSKIQPFLKPLKYCKATFIYTTSNYVVTHGNSDSARRFRRRIRMYINKWINKQMRIYIRDSIQSSLAYYNNYDDHHEYLKLVRFGHSLFHKTFMKAG